MMKEYVIPSIEVLELLGEDILTVSKSNFDDVMDAPEIWFSPSF